MTPKAEHMESHDHGTFFIFPHLEVGYGKDEVGLSFLHPNPVVTGIRSWPSEV